MLERSVGVVPLRLDYVRVLEYGHHNEQRHRAHNREHGEHSEQQTVNYEGHQFPLAYVSAYVVLVLG